MNYWVWHYNANFGGRPELLGPFVSEALANQRRDELGREHCRVLIGGVDDDAANKAQDVVDETAPRVRALCEKLRGVARYMELGDDRDNLIVYINELSQVGTMLAISATEES